MGVDKFHENMKEVAELAEKIASFGDLTCPGFDDYENNKDYCDCHSHCQKQNHIDVGMLFEFLLGKVFEIEYGVEWDTDEFYKINRMIWDYLDETRQPRDENHDLPF